MKQRLFLFLALCFSIFATLMAQDKQDAITMISYEQSYHDINGTLALKNNTDSTIHDLTFVITYLDMNGTELDYQEYSISEEIAPGMTKKVDIPAYESNRYYSYYKSETSPMEPHRFKIKFEVKDINSITEDTSISSVNYTPRRSTIPHTTDIPEWSYGAVLLVILFSIGVFVGLYVLVALMAQKRRRNPALWVLVSLFASPLLAIIILLCIGKSSEYHEEF